MIAETLLDFATTVAVNIAKAITANWVKSKGSEFLGLDRNDFAKELESIIYETITQYGSTFPIPQEGQKFPFYKSEKLIQTLMSIKFIGKGYTDIEELKKLLEQNPNIIPPKNSEIFKFLDLFEENCKNSSTLRKHQFSTNYREAIFEVLSIVESIQNTLDRIIAEIKTSLTSEYFSQLEEVQNNINSFKPITALERLSSLEERIKRENKMTPEIESKILFLKGSCFLETNKGLQGGELIVRAFLTLNNGSLKSEAAIAYLNLNEKTHAKKLADEIIDTDYFNGNAWFIRLILSENNFKEIWKDIPVTLKSKKGFVVNVIQHILQHNLGDTFFLEELGLKLPTETDEKFTHSNINIWERVAYIKLHIYFSSIKEFSIDIKGKLAVFNLEGLEALLALLKKFFDTINNTEVYANYPMLRFYYSFCRHLLNDNSFNKEEFINDYAKLKTASFHFDLHYAEYLANQGSLDEALRTLNSSKYKLEESIFLHRILYTKATGNEQDFLTLLKEHIELVEEIDFVNIFNLNNLFNYYPQNNILLKQTIQDILSKKSFKNENIKKLFQVTIDINHFPDTIKKSDLKTGLPLLAESFKNETHIIFYISQLLYRLEAFSECSTLLEPLVENGKQTQINLLYGEARLLGNVELKSLIHFFAQIRLANENNIYKFLAIENNLRQTIDDIDSLIDIAWRGIKQHPQIEHFHNNLLSALEREQSIEQIREYVKKYLKNDFRDENIGIWVSTILSRTGFPKEASQILYQLAVKPSNHSARTSYVTRTKYPDGFFIDYDEIELGSFVKLSEAGKGIKLLKVDSSDKYRLIGKKVGDVVMIPEKLSSAIKEFRVSRVMNNHLFLLEQILHEAEDSNSELGLITFDFTNENGEFDKDAFEKYFINQFASDENTIQKLREEKVDTYKRGESSFSELCINVFNDNPFDCYQYLTSEIFFAIPSHYNSLLKLSDTETFVLDFTSLLLLSDLKRMYDISVNIKYIVSTSLVTVIKNEIIKLESYPEPKMQLTYVGGKLIPRFYPEDYQKNKLDEYNTLLQFVSENCNEQVIEEKVMFSEFFERRNKYSPYFNYLIDNAMFCTNLEYTLVTNDAFILKQFKHLNPKIISPENFLIRYFKTNFPKEIMDYFIQKRYVGIILNKDVLWSEYQKKQKGEPNSFNHCISTLKYRWCSSPVNIIAGIKFLKEVYTNSLALDAEIFLLSQTIFLNLLDGCANNEKITNLIRASIQYEFALLGESLNKVCEAFEISLSSYSLKF